MPENTGLLSTNLCDPAWGTGGEATSQHAASVRPCARKPHGSKQASRASERDVEIIVGPRGPVIQFRKEKQAERTRHNGRSNSTN